MSTTAADDLSCERPGIYLVHRAKYAKGKYIIRPLDSRDGFKGRSNWAIDDLRLHYVNRSHGYTASPAQVRKFIAAMDEEYPR